MVWYDVWLTLGITPERSQWQRGGLHEPCKLLESSPSTSSRPREGAEMKMVWCSDYMLLLKAISSIVDIMIFLEFFKVYLDFLNTRAHKCPTANLTQRLKVKVFLNSKMSSESQISTKKTVKVQQKWKIVQIQPPYILIQFKLLSSNKESRSITNMKYFFQEVPVESRYFWNVFSRWRRAVIKKEIGPGNTNIRQNTNSLPDELSSLKGIPLRTSSSNANIKTKDWEYFPKSGQIFLFGLAWYSHKIIVTIKD